MDVFLGVEVEMRDLNDLIPYANNPRRISLEAVEKVADSIMRFGFNVPVVVGTDGVIAAGHTRVRAALLAGLDQVPVIVRDLSEEQLRAYRIADNRVGELTDWDWDALRAIFEDLQERGRDLSATGFGGDEIDRLLRGSVADPVESDEEFLEDDASDPVSDGLVEVSVRAEPHVRDRFDRLMADAGGRGASDALRLWRLMQCVDRDALAVMVRR